MYLDPWLGRFEHFEDLKRLKLLSGVVVAFGLEAPGLSTIVSDAGPLHS